MTIIELFDDNPINNIAALLANSPDKVIFLGEGSVMKHSVKAIETIIQAHKLKTETEYVSVNKNSLSDITSKLEMLLYSYDDCCINLTGGSDLCLVAAGRVFEKMKSLGKNTDMFIYNRRTGKVYDCDGDGIKHALDFEAKLDIYDFVTLRSGTISDLSFHNEDASEFADISAVWNICRDNSDIWNKFCMALALLTREMPPNALDFFCSCSAFPDSLKESEFYHLFDLLSAEKLILDYRREKESITFSFKNVILRKILTVAGLSLELAVYTAAGIIPAFSSRANGVKIKWQNDSKSNAYEPYNEIDVTLVRGLTPIFISCKNGSVDDEELYKLNTVARHFGGRNVKKYLIGTTLGKQQNNPAFFSRAEAMDITIIDNIQNYDVNGIAKLLSEFGI